MKEPDSPLFKAIQAALNTSGFRDTARAAGVDHKVVHRMFTDPSLHPSIKNHLRLAREANIDLDEYFAAYEAECGERRVE